VRSRIAAVIIAAAVIGGSYAADPGGGGFDGTCLVSNRAEWSLAGTDCDVGTLVTVTETVWVCTFELSTLGPLPIKVVVAADESYEGNAAELNNGCSGDDDPDTIDLILEVQGNGAEGTFGPSDDAFKFKPFGQEGPDNIQMTGAIDCGPRRTGLEHSDAFQNQAELGTPMAMVNMTSGDYDAGTSTCQAAGGLLFWSEIGDIDVYGGEFIGCNHGLNGGGTNPGAGSTVTDAKFRSGRNNDGDPNCDFTYGGVCINTAGMTLTNVTAERWIAASDTWQEDPCTP
jgi:hypothetical protein